MPEANSAPSLSNPPSRLLTLAPDPAHKPKPLDRLREALHSRHYSPRPEFRHGLFHLTHMDLLGQETPSPLAACVAMKRAPSFPRNLSLQALSREPESRMV
jgi:hypothetical protein